MFEEEQIPTVGEVEPIVAEEIPATDGEPIEETDAGIETPPVEEEV